MYLVCSEVARDESQLRSVDLQRDQDASLVGEHVQKARVFHAVLHVGDPGLQIGLGENKELHLSALGMFHL